MAAAANHRLSQKIMDDTFYLSNMAPQVEFGIIDYVLKFISDFLINSKKEKNLIFMQAYVRNFFASFTILTEYLLSQLYHL